MKVRFAKNPTCKLISNRFNTSSHGEVIVYGDIIGANSAFISDLEVEINKIKLIGFNHIKIKEWIPLSIAFKNHDVITDNYNTKFFEPKTLEDRNRGYTEE